MKRIGVFVCWCGSNIGGVVDVPKVAEVAKSFPSVAFTQEYKYTCSEPGQEMMIQAIKEHNLDRIVVASCSPRMHEQTFRKTIARAGLNPYLLEMANIREHCSWIHPDDPEDATEKAINLVRKAVSKVAKLVPLYEENIPIVKRALVIGGGIAGIQAALDIADHGHEVILLEKQPTIGGKMALLDKTFPTLDCSACICTPKMVDAAQHPNITIYSYSEVDAVSGYIGNFDVTIKKKARFVDLSKCTGCGLCETKCPTKVTSEYEQGMGTRPCIYKPFPQAVPNKPVIDPINCKKIKDGKCGVCAKICPTGAINYEDKDVLVTEKFGAIVVATGFELFDWTVYKEYGGGNYPDVITSMQFERLLNASGPTSGKIKRPSDKKTPETIVFIKCVGSRDEAKGKKYCSRACCMYTAKHATQAREKLPDSQVYVFYMDVRTPGKLYDEFYTRATDQYGAKYVRGRVSKIFQSGDKLIVRGEDTLLGKEVEINADMVVLATAMVPIKEASQLAQKIGFSYDKDGFFTEAHPKLRPVDTNTAGIYLAGCCQGPKDIPDTVSQACGAASKVGALFSKDTLTTNPMISEVDPSMCSGCLQCSRICPFSAISGKDIKERIHGKEVTRVVADINSGLCQGCGACVPECRSGALNLKGFTNEQLLAEVDAACL